MAQSRTGFHPEAIICLLACLAPGTEPQRRNGNMSPHLNLISLLAMALLHSYLWSSDLWSLGWQGALLRPCRTLKVEKKWGSCPYGQSSHGHCQALAPMPVAAAPPTWELPFIELSVLSWGWNTCRLIPQIWKAHWKILEVIWSSPLSPCVGRK